VTLYVRLEGDVKREKYIKNLRYIKNLIYTRNAKLRIGIKEKILSAR
jgi:tetrahydromethanopterin S-methyltransferase subunit F